MTSAQIEQLIKKIDSVEQTTIQLKDDFTKTIVNLQNDFAKRIAELMAENKKLSESVATINARQRDYEQKALEILGN